MRDPAYVRDRGDAEWLAFNSQAGHEQAERRPALILSPARYNGRFGLAIACPITNQAKGYPFEVAIPGDLTVTGVVLADQVKNLDWKKRDADFICRVPKDAVNNVLEKLSALPDPDG